MSCQANYTEDNIEPFFTINLLAPDTCQRQNQWIYIMIEELPKIGIEIKTFDHTSLTEIMQRTYNYSGPYPIPDYELGGYDILASEIITGDIDWNPMTLFHSSSIIPDGRNIYQYSNQEMDWCINNYISSYNLTDRIK